ncbi:MAG: hypothetical protein IJ874_03285 [Ruminococcus sp.]|nr:hypothetical protein [Ruminococcus sp.]
MRAVTILLSAAILMTSSAYSAAAETGDSLLFLTAEEADLVREGRLAAVPGELGYELREVQRISINPEEGVKNYVITKNGDEWERDYGSYICLDSSIFGEGANGDEMSGACRAAVNAGEHDLAVAKHDGRYMYVFRISDQSYIYTGGESAEFDDTWVYLDPDGAYDKLWGLAVDESSYELIRVQYSDGIGSVWYDGDDAAVITADDLDDGNSVFIYEDGSVAEGAVSLFSVLPEWDHSPCYVRIAGGTAYPVEGEMPIEDEREEFSAAPEEGADTEAVIGETSSAVTAATYDDEKQAKPDNGRRKSSVPAGVISVAGFAVGAVLLYLSAKRLSDDKK